MSIWEIRGTMEDAAKSPEMAIESIPYLPIGSHYLSDSTVTEHQFPVGSGRSLLPF